MIAVANTLGFDILKLYGAALAEHIPELTVLRPEEVKDPSAVEVLLTFAPPDDACTPYPNLKAVISTAAGVEAILKCPTLPKGVAVARVEDDDQALQMAGFSVFHLLWHHRRMGQHLRDQEEAVWNSPDTGRSPAGCRVGVMGFGLMGRAVARAVAALGYPTASLSRSQPNPAEPGVTHYLDQDRAEFLARCDVVINVLPLTPATHGIIDAAFLAALPVGASLIHIGRGDHLNEADLLAALDSGHISGATLDAFSVEPLPKTHPFWPHPSIFVTPHTASSPEPQAVAHSIGASLRKLLAGEPLADRFARGY